MSWAEQVKTKDALYDLLYVQFIDSAEFLNTDVLGTDEAIIYADSGSSRATVVVPRGKKYIADRSAWINEGTSVSTVIIPRTIERIESYAFNGLNGLKNLFFCNGITSIYSSAFVSNNSLVSLSFPPSLSYIASDAIVNCENLSHIYLPHSEGELGGAPWGAINANIHYNCPNTFLDL